MAVRFSYARAQGRLESLRAGRGTSGTDGHGELVARVAALRSLVGALESQGAESLSRLSSRAGELQELLGTRLASAEGAMSEVNDATDLLLTETEERTGAVVSVDEVLSRDDPAARAELLARRVDVARPRGKPGPRPARAARNDADWMSADIARLRDVAARLEARLMATPLSTLTPGAAEILSDALVALTPVLRALGGAIRAATGRKDAA